MKKLLVCILALLLLMGMACAEPALLPDGLTWASAPDEVIALLGWPDLNEVTGSLREVRYLASAACGSAQHSFLFMDGELRMVDAKSHGAAAGQDFDSLLAGLEAKHGPSQSLGFGDVESFLSVRLGGAYQLGFTRGRCWQVAPGTQLWLYEKAGQAPGLALVSTSRASGAAASALPYSFTWATTPGEVIARLGEPEWDSGDDYRELGYADLSLWEGEGLCAFLFVDDRLRMVGVNDFEGDAADVFARLRANYTVAHGEPAALSAGTVNAYNTAMFGENFDMPVDEGLCWKLSDDTQLWLFTLNGQDVCIMYANVAEEAAPAAPAVGLPDGLTWATTPLEAIALLGEPDDDSQRGDYRELGYDDFTYRGEPVALTSLMYVENKLQLVGVTGFEGDTQERFGQLRGELTNELGAATPLTAEAVNEYNQQRLGATFEMPVDDGVCWQVDADTRLWLFTLDGQEVCVMYANLAEGEVPAAPEAPAAPASALPLGIAWDMSADDAKALLGDPEADDNYGTFRELDYNYVDYLGDEADLLALLYSSEKLQLVGLCGFEDMDADALTSRFEAEFGPGRLLTGEQVNAYNREHLGETFAMDVEDGLWWQADEQTQLWLFTLSDGEVYVMYANATAARSAATFSLPDYAHWGMSAAELLAVRGNNVVRDDGAGARPREIDVQALVLGQPARIGYLFVDDQLTMASLLANDSGLIYDNERLIDECTACFGPGEPLDKYVLVRGIVKGSGNTVEITDEEIAGVDVDGSMCWRDGDSYVWVVNLGIGYQLVWIDAQFVD